MDLLDFEIALELTRHPFVSYRKLGRRVGLSGNSVMGRLDRMHRTGIFEGFYVLPTALIFQRHWQVMNFVLKASEPNLHEILKVDNVVMVWRGRPRALMVNVYAKNNDDAPPPRLETLLGGLPVEILDPDPKDSNIQTIGTVSSLDWRIMDALLDDPTVSLARLAEQTGLTTRSVGKRRDLLVHRGLLRVLPGFNTSQESGLILFSGQIICKALADLDTIQAQGMNVMHRLFNPPGVWVFGHASTYSDLLEIEARIKENPAVVSVELAPSRGGAFARERLHDWIRRELVFNSVPPSVMVSYAGTTE